jgi:hypothetical protein
MEIDSQRTRKFGMLAWALGVAALGVVAVPESVLTARLSRVSNQGPFNTTDVVFSTLADSAEVTQRAVALLDRIPKTNRLWIIRTGKSPAFSESSLALSILSWPRPTTIVDWPIPSTGEREALPDSAFVIGNLSGGNAPSIQLGPGLFFIPKVQP